MLDLSAMVEPPSAPGSVMYALNGFISHLGPTIRNGHYVTYVQARTGEGMGWFKCDDCTVTPSTWAEVNRAEPYVLAYERVETTDVDTGVAELSSEDDNINNNNKRRGYGCSACAARNVAARHRAYGPQCPVPRPLTQQSK
eukprot:TRINITY_DN10257_c0_g1_i2.p2 TRINITY_DN10257_c0_g1~~TRINITY_DN10257_c0_g1_i2.p2  ORF type:complete len:141 (-),score=24.48 TRINITY_DN10257_c0_g1_i2:64-486(-)